jgi:glyoxylase-like metal-dependent hydrolase (beta-lactamase superfamily II)
MHIGSTEIIPVPDGLMHLRPEVLYPTSTPAELGRHPELRNEDGMLPLPDGAFLVRAADGRIVLVDAGGGADFEVPPEAGELVESARLLTGMSAAGVAPRDITDVILSHLHADHFGWVSTAGEVTFPNAVLHVHAADLDHFLPASGEVPDERVPLVLGPALDVVETWSGPETDVAGVRLIHVPGHTPGMAIAVIGGPGGLALVGDLVHCTAEFGEDWTGGQDVDPDLALANRRDLAWRLAAEGTQVTGPHFPDLATGVLTAIGDDIEWVRSRS